MELAFRSGMECKFHLGSRTEFVLRSGVGDGIPAVVGACPMPLAAGPSVSGRLGDAITSPSPSSLANSARVVDPLTRIRERASGSSFGPVTPKRVVTAVR